MSFLIVLTKIFVMLLSVALVAIPFVVEFFRFSRDKKNKVSHRRFRVLAYTLIFMLVATIVMCIIKESLYAAKDYSFVKWLTEQVSVPDRLTYTANVFATVYVNFIIGLIFCAAGKLARIGITKRSLTKPLGADGNFTKEQLLERKIVRFFNTETWFFVGNILKYFNTSVSVVYGVIFLVYMMPGMFGAKWIPYDFVQSLFNGGYLYPVITLAGLWEAFFFLRGVQNIVKECPEFSGKAEDKKKEDGVCLESIDEEVKKQFKNFYVCDLEMSDSHGDELSATRHHSVTEYIGQAVENDGRNPGKKKELYLNCVDKLAENNDSLLINGSFFSEFSAYFLRYLSVIVARGDNAVFVCNSRHQVEDVYNYLNEGMSQISSIYCKNFETEGISFDTPIWKIVKMAGRHNMIEEAAIDDASILVTSLDYLCSKEFETEHTRFIHLLDTVVFVNTSETVNLYNRQLAMLNTRLKHITRNNAVMSKNSRINPGFKIRYMSREVRYICFDDTRSPGLDKVLKNMFAVKVASVDAMQYSPKTLVRCYNYEAGMDENGRCVCPQFLNTEEKIDAVMNIAFLCLAGGADTVDVFVEGKFPFENISESISANEGQIVIDADTGSIRLNRHSYSQEGCNVIIALDTGNNLPAALRRYISMASGKPALIIVLSKPYMLRDYYSENISDIWRSHQIIRVPVEEGTKKDIAQRIIVKANAGGVSEDEILRLASGVPQFDEFIKSRNVNAILRAVLEIYGLPQEDRIDLFKYFEYVSTRDFDENGLYTHEDKVILRRQGKLYDMLCGSNVAVMVNGDSEVSLNVPKRRISQRYIAGQNLIHEGNIYYIQKIDAEAGKIYVKLSVGGKNEEAYSYIQKREYKLDFNRGIYETGYALKHVVLNRKDEGVSVNDIFVSVFRAPMEVLTKGYYKIDPQRPVISPDECKYYSIADGENEVLAKQTYRRYGIMTNPAYSSDSVLKETGLNADSRPAQIMAIRMTGKFSADMSRVASLAAVMLNEVLHSIFPSVADEVVVCPVIPGGVSGEDAENVLQMQPKLTIEGKCEYLPEGDFELLIIEDSDTDLGVISVLMSSGDDLIKTLFAPLYSYLSWYMFSEKKSTYLYGGLDKEPDCFDFAGLLTLSGILGNSKQGIRFVELGSVVEYDDCDFCGQRCKKSDGLTVLEDGRRMCKACGDSIVGDNRKMLAEHLSQAMIYLESTYGVTLNDEYNICFESTMKIINSLKQGGNIVRGNFDVPLKSYVDDKKNIHVENSIPSVSLGELLVRELTYAWQMKNAPDTAYDLKEGHMALVAVQYLRFLNDKNRADARTIYYESTSNPSGEGYRKIARSLLENPGWLNNPFRCMDGGAGAKENVPVIKPKEKESRDLGLSYIPAVPDRVIGGKPSYMHYSRLTGAMKAAYDILVSAIQEHTESVVIEDCSFEELCEVSRAVSYDRPEFFWYDTLSVCGNDVNINYCATAEESADLQKRIDEAVPKFLEGIDDSMSAYDVALRIHDKLMRYVDYDTLALKFEKEDDGSHELDYLRTICGVFLNGKAVCAGYCNAATYLLQKCGVECTGAAGHIRNEDGTQGEGHAWNILKIDGEYYQMDVTWDDRSNTVQQVKRTDTGFDYFCVTTEEMSRTREFDLCATEAPLCTATKANYYTHNDMVIDSYNLDKIKEIAVKAAKNQNDSFTFKCSSPVVYETALERLAVAGGDCFEVLKIAAKANRQILDTKYSYTYDKNIRTVTISFRYKNR